MQAFILLSALIIAATAIVCPPDVCDNIEKPLLSCKGGLNKGSGWCGCTDSCAKVAGEECHQPTNFLFLGGFVEAVKCDEGLVCNMVYLEGRSHSARCVNASEELFVSKKRSAHMCETACEKKSSACNFSFVIYSGQWFAKCDAEGQFLAQQCNNINECFCVEEDGTIDETTRVLGATNCS